MKAGCRRMLYLTCFVTVFLWSKPRIFGYLGKSPGKRRFFTISNFTFLISERSGGLAPLLA